MSDSSYFNFNNTLYHEDKNQLNQKQRVRLEALAQANMLGSRMGIIGSTEVLRIADDFRKFIDG